MGRGMNEILNVLMQMELNFSRMYRNISEIEGKYSLKLKNISAVLANEEAKHYEWFKNLIEDASLSDISITEEIYEEARKNLKDFKESIAWPQTISEKAIIEAAYHYELENSKTLIAIREKVIELNKDDPNELLKFLDNLIMIEKKHADNLHYFLNNG